MRLTNLNFTDFPPFEDSAIEFPPLSVDEEVAEIQFFVGANGAGKTRLLTLLLDSLGNPSELEQRCDKQPNFAVFAETGNRTVVYLSKSEGVFTGNITRKFRDNPLTPMVIYDYDLEHLTSGLLRAGKRIDRGMSTTALAFRGASADINDSDVMALQPVMIGKPVDHLTFNRVENEDSIIGQSMVNLKLGAAMDMLDPESSQRSTRITQRLEGAVKKITGRPFSFRVEPHPKVNLRVTWGDAKMLKLAQLPDGLRAIIGWLVSCAAKLEAQFPDDPDPLDANVILVIDEPEGHLHPAWQRTLLPAVQVLLPNAQIFVATHSPWIISSVNAGWIHVLRPDEDGSVKVESPVACSKGDSYIEVVEDILGITERYDPETESLLSEFRELRDQCKLGKAKTDEVISLAREIGDRSESLSMMMGREIWQLKQQTEFAEAG